MFFHLLFDGFVGTVMVFELIFEHEDFFVEEGDFVLKLLHFEILVEILLG